MAVTSPFWSISTSTMQYELKFADAKHMKWIVSPPQSLMDPMSRVVLLSTLATLIDSALITIIRPTFFISSTKRVKYVVSVFVNVYVLTWVTDYLLHLSVPLTVYVSDEGLKYTAYLVTLLLSLIKALR